jgi:phospholipid/cholesterol/gamma-HCH transport system substrate-binding protein
MPRTRSLAWSELKIGALTIAAIAIAAFVIFLLSGEGGFFWQQYTLHARFTDVALLKPGAPVRVAGVEVGAVDDLQFDGAEVVVTFSLSREMQPRVTDQSIAYIGSVSLLGEGALDITPALAGTPIPDGGSVKTKRAPGQLADVAEAATQGLNEATQLIKDMRAGKGTVGKLFSDEKLYQEISGFVDAAEAVAKNLQQGQGTAGKLLTDDALYKRFDALTGRLDTLTRELNDGKGTAGQLLKDQKLYDNLNAAASELRGLVADIRQDPQKYLRVKVSLF